MPEGIVPGRKRSRGKKSQKGLTTNADGEPIGGKASSSLARRPGGQDVRVFAACQKSSPLYFCRAPARRMASGFDVSPMRHQANGQQDTCPDETNQVTMRQPRLGGDIPRAGDETRSASSRPSHACRPRLPAITAAQGNSRKMKRRCAESRRTGCGLSQITCSAVALAVPAETWGAGAVLRIFAEGALR